MKKNPVMFNEHEVLIYTLHELIVGDEIICVTITLQVTPGGVTYLIMLEGPPDLLSK